MPVVIKLKPDSHKTKTYLVRLQTSEICLINLDKYSQKNCLDNQNIGPLKYWFRLSIFQISYLIDDIDYRLSLALKFKNFY
jgi:hypothetical protein